MISRNWSKGFLPIFLLCLGVLGLVGCSDLPEKKVKVNGPWIEDTLAGNSSMGVADAGTFTDQGWCPGPDGTLTYEIPVLPQGQIEFDITGFQRNGPDTIFLSMFEKPALDYPNPYILLNPYRVTLSSKNFDTSPESPLELLWTIKNFPAATPTEQRYVKGLPDGVEGIEKAVLSDAMPLFVDQTYRVSLRWKYGVARLAIDGRQIAELNFQPHVYNASTIHVVFGKTPGAAAFDLPTLVISNVVISFAEF